MPLGRITLLDPCPLHKASVISKTDASFVKLFTPSAREPSRKHQWHMCTTLGLVVMLSFVELDPATVGMEVWFATTAIMDLPAVWICLALKTGTRSP